MKEFILICLPFWAPALFILAIAVIGHLFNIRSIKESFKF